MTSKELSQELTAIGHAISGETIRKDWTKGAPRCSAGAYLRWRAKNAEKSGRGDPALRELKAEKLTEEIAVLKIRRQLDDNRLAVEQGKLVEISKVHEAQDRCCARAVAILVQKFETELPPKEDGLPAEKIAEMNRAALDEVRAILSKRETYV